MFQQPRFSPEPRQPVVKKLRFQLRIFGRGREYATARAYADSLREAEVAQIHSWPI